MRSRAEVSEKRQYVVVPPQAPLQGRNTWPSSSPSKFASEAESFPKCEKKKTVDVISLGGEALPGSVRAARPQRVMLKLTRKACGCLQNGGLSLEAAFARTTRNAFWSLRAAFACLPRDHKRGRKLLHASREGEKLDLDLSFAFSVPC